MVLTRRAVVAAGVGSLLGQSTAHAQRGYPRKPIALVVTFAAGGGTDVLARIAAKYLPEDLGQPVNVVNKPGGNSIPGAMSVMTAAPDGYTLLFDSPATSSLHALVSDLPYKVEERTWGPMVTTGPYIYAVNAKSEWKSLKEVIEAARRDPSSLRIGWMGGTSFTDTTMLKLLSVGGVDLTKVKKVPFAGSGPAMVALAGGHIDLSGGNIGAATSLIASGDLKALAVSGDERVPALANVPSSKEAGVFVPLTSWKALSGPPGMPAVIVRRLDDAVVKMVKREDYVKDLANVGNLPTYKGGAEMPASGQPGAGTLSSDRARVGREQEGTSTARSTGLAHFIDPAVLMLAGLAAVVDGARIIMTKREVVGGVEAGGWIASIGALLLAGSGFLAMGSPRYTLMQRRRTRS